MVTMGDGTLKPIEDLRMGDFLMDHNGQSSELVSWFHFNRTEEFRNYLELVTAKTSLIVSSEHNIGFCQSDGSDPIFGLASYAKPGSYLCSHDGTPQEILEVKQVQASGAYAPLPSSSRYIVNGFHVHAFAVIENPTFYEWTVQQAVRIFPKPDESLEAYLHPIASFSPLVSLTRSSLSGPTNRRRLRASGSNRRSSSSKTSSDQKDMMMMLASTVTQHLIPLLEEDSLG
jgi:hypothetical protein